ncbi:hypothetical protein MOF05_07085 [Bacillus haynesii]|nr:hypothetical protein [Bacillus haynesii]MCY9288156.1 hypothetical protein [Bacillus haynesii]
MLTITDMFSILLANNIFLVALLTFILKLVLELLKLNKKDPTDKNQ